MNLQTPVPNKEKEPSDVFDHWGSFFVRYDEGKEKKQNAETKLETKEVWTGLDPTADKKTGSSPYAASCDYYPKHPLIKMEISVSGSLEKEKAGVPLP